MCTQEAVESTEKQGPDNMVPISLIPDRKRERNFCEKPDCYYSPYLFVKIAIQNITSWLD